MYTMKLAKNTLIFTDLDGTLLDHHDYSFNKATFMLEFIKKNNIPLIIVTSKTRDEAIALQKLLHVKSISIVENGAGIIIPKGDSYEEVSLGLSYKTIRSAFERYAKSIPIRGFFDMSVEEIMHYTNLSQNKAIEAKNRTFTEPFILDDIAQLKQLKELANADGLDVIKGGRFYHLITKGQDKAHAVKNVIEHYEKKLGQGFTTIALGDSANDLSMLQNVDVPILIPHPDGSYLKCDIPHLIKATSPGPEGWNKALKEYFNVK